MNETREYGPVGLVGIGTPQANPTVEAELRILLPPEVGMAVARLTSPFTDPCERLRHYFRKLEQTLSQYDTLRLGAFGFGCTASSYLMNSGEEDRLVSAAEQHFGYSVFTACGAIEWQLRRSGVRRLALVSPYPAEIAEAAAEFWRRRGFEVAAAGRIETRGSDTRGIYGLRSEDARAVVTVLRRLNVDAILLSGTGMPTLRLIAEGSVPALLSSNLCLALRLCDAIGAPPPCPQSWRRRLNLAIGRPEGESGS